MTPPQVCIVGAGMIVQVQILPSIYQLQRLGVIGAISICGSRAKSLRRLAADATLKEAFPGQGFEACPSLDGEPDDPHPELFRDVLANIPRHSIVVIAVPDPLHYAVIKTALQHEHHICCVKPLVLEHRQAVEIGDEAFAKGLVVGVEYHKRFDSRALLARRQYRAGLFGEFRVGHAEMNEPYYYRRSNFQNWCTCDTTDMFTYVGCHYTDQLHFITGLLPKRVSVYGIKDTYPNGNEGYLWTDARIVWENGGCLHVTNVMGYPDEGPGGNFQGIRLYCAGDNKSGMLVHNDQYRGVEYCYVTKGDAPGDTYYSEPSPDYFKYIDLGGGGLTPVGYGYRSIEYIVKGACKAVEVSGALPENAALEKRQGLLAQFDAEGIMATPRNSAYNELVTEAGRLSILNDSREAEIMYGDPPGVRLRDY